MRLLNCNIIDFRGIKNTSFDFSTSLNTVLVGQNGTGKTSTLEILYMILSTWNYDVRTIMTEQRLWEGRFYKKDAHVIVTVEHNGIPQEVELKYDQVFALEWILHGDYVSREGQVFGFPAWRNRRVPSEENFDKVVELYSKVFLETPSDLGCLSDGQQSVCSILCDLIPQPNNSIIFIDNIELFLHPPLQQGLIRVLRNIGTNNQIICTTHSDSVLTMFDESDGEVLRFPNL